MPRLRTVFAFSVGCIGAAAWIAWDLGRTIDRSWSGYSFEEWRRDAHRHAQRTRSFL